MSTKPTDIQIKHLYNTMLDDIRHHTADTRRRVAIRLGALELIYGEEETIRLIDLVGKMIEDNQKALRSEPNHE